MPLDHASRRDRTHLLGRYVEKYRKDWKAYEEGVESGKDAKERKDEEKRENNNLHLFTNTTVTKRIRT